MKNKLRLGRNLGALAVAGVLAFGCGFAALPKSGRASAEENPAVAAAPAATAETGGRNEYRSSLSIDYSVPSVEQDGWVIKDNRVTASGHKIGAWGTETAWKAVPAAEGRKGGVEFSFTGTEDGDRTAKAASKFYTMISNHSRGITTISLTLDKLGEGDLLEFDVYFWDVVSLKNVGAGDFKEQYNALEVGNNQTISLAVDMSHIGSVDSMLLEAHADILSAKFCITGAELAWGDSQVSSADDCFRDADDSVNVVFRNMVRKGQSKEFTNMPLAGFAPGDGYAGETYDSGRGDYSDANGKITAENTETMGEHFRLGYGTSNAWRGMWFKFPFDTSGGKVNISFTMAKAVESGFADSANIEFQFHGKDETGTRTLKYTNSKVTYGEQEISGAANLSALKADGWTTFTVNDLDISGITGWDSLGIWFVADGESDEGHRQAFLLRDVSLWTSGGIREEALPEDDPTVDSLKFASGTGVTLKRDYLGMEYMELKPGTAEGGISATRALNPLADGKYKTVLNLRKTAALSEEFKLNVSGTKGGAAVAAAAADLTQKVKDAPVGTWFTVETEEFEVLNDAIDSLGVTFGGTGEDKLDLGYIGLMRAAEYVEGDIGFGVEDVFVRDFTALNGMDVDEFDLSQNGFPEVGNWSDQFPDLRSQGQKVVRDTDGTPVMKLYRRSQEEIEEAKTTYKWPDDREYFPSNESHFFVTAPISAGYVQVNITARRGENFKGTSDFSLDGYMGSEPWWSLANFTQELAEAKNGEWVTYSENIFLPRAINTIKIKLETLWEDSDLYVRDISVVRKANSATGFWDATVKGDLSWRMITENTVTAVKTEGIALSAADYSYENGILTFKESYLATLANGAHEYEVSDGTGTVTLSVTCSKVAPVVLDESVRVKLNSKDDVVINVDFKNSAIRTVSINDKNLEEDVGYTYDADGNKLVLKASAFEGLEEGEATLVITTRAGVVSFSLELVKSNVGLIVGISVGAGVLGLAGVAAIIVVVLRKKKRK